MMRITILRQDGPGSAPYRETFSYEDEPHLSVMELLEYLNKHPESRVAGEEPFRAIAYDCSCEQGLCGACAMVLNGRPCLACQEFCDEIAEHGAIEIRPLGKFDVIRDLMVDRTVLSEALAQMDSWLVEDALVPKRSFLNQYEAARCLQCGCCLEACPNYATGDLFVGAAGALGFMDAAGKVPKGAHKDEMDSAYRKRFFKTCSKNGACEKACPAKLPTMTLVSEANRTSVWGFWQRFGRR